MIVRYPAVEMNIFAQRPLLGRTVVTPRMGQPAPQASPRAIERVAEANRQLERVQANFGRLSQLIGPGNATVAVEQAFESVEKARNQEGL
jgi:hypothetical protein